MIVIFGHGGCAREVYATFKDMFGFMVDEKYRKDEIPKEKYKDYELVICIGDPVSRKEAVDSMPGATYISLSKGLIMDAVIGEGTIIQPGVIITTNVKIGKHCLINLNATIGHDCKLGDYVTVSPAANISGNVTIGDLCYIGSNAVIREKITICDRVTIGAGAVVVKNITEPGIYVGNPVRKL